jgi:DNA-directed RNA polymerase subunit omega
MLFVPSSGPKGAECAAPARPEYRQQEVTRGMKLKIMENALDTCTNRFELTMMAVARAKEINDGETPLIDAEDQSKPVVIALKEISEGKVVPATHGEMAKIRDAKRFLRERALRIAEEEGLLEENDIDETYASAHPDGSTSDS